jgi:hypothetical protein
MPETIRIQSDPDVMTEIEALLRADDAGSEGVESVQIATVESDGMGADFGVEILAALLAIVSHLFFDGPIVPKLYKLLRKHRGKRVTIDTETRKITIEVTDDFTLEQLKALLAAALATS